MVKQARLTWSAQGGAGGESVMHFDDAASAADINSILRSGVLAMASVLAASTTVTLNPTIRILDTATGMLTDEEGAGAWAPVVGTGGPSSVPNAAQGLIRARTSTFVRGRRLQGRVFIPGLSTAAQAATGHLSTTAISALQGGADEWDALGTWVIWSRPVDGVGGVAAAVNTTDVWDEFAVQRRRRS